ncbi:hypothetical protein ACFSC4_00980 [Deinococcus malanensis]|uniref:hypothetical protein n=1 Tax=Deinococcus malanensis TaxID=1706855 RepID=UPI00363F753F
MLPSVGAGGVLGAGLGSLLGLDTAVAALVGATAFLTVTLNVPVAAALLAVAWGGDALLPALLLAAGLAHVLSSTAGLVPSQVDSRQDSGMRRGAVLLPEGIRFAARRVPEPAEPAPVNCSTHRPRAGRPTVQDCRRPSVNCTGAECREAGWERG